MGSASNSDVAHNWANQTGRKCNGGNMHYDGVRLFSYRTEIARLYDVYGTRYAVITSRRYSSTTNGKHINAAHSAVSHLQSLAYSDHVGNLALNWSDAARQLLTDHIERFNDQFEKLKRARSHIENGTYHLQMSAKTISWLLLEVKERSPEYQKFHDLYNADDTPERLSILLNAWGFDFARKIELERTAEERNAPKREKERARREARAQKLAEEKLAREAENAENWRKGLYHQTLHSLPVMLRTSGNELQTSHGARVSMQSARALYEALNAGQNIVGVQIDGFTVLAVTPEHIKIGCHIIPRSEVDRLFADRTSHLYLVQ